MSIKTRIAKLEKELLPATGKRVEVIFCREKETGTELCKRLGIDTNDGVLRIAVVFE